MRLFTFAALFIWAMATMAQPLHRLSPRMDDKEVTNEEAGSTSHNEESTTPPAKRRNARYPVRWRIRDGIRMDRTAEGSTENRLRRIGNWAGRHNPIQGFQSAEIRNPFGAFGWEDAKTLAAAAWASKTVPGPVPMVKGVPMVL
ncbi:MAG: hypothetical protein M1823_000106 [Watsoniomyces obsoletus]|nr:MAG: hypothetical protein M1823_000106 [Watsoniomyces obsoletus]